MTGKSGLLFTFFVLAGQIPFSHPTGNNSESSIREKGDQFALGISYLVVSGFVISTNAIVIFVIVKTRVLHQPTLWVIAHMAFWDFLQGMNYLIFAVPSAFMNQFAYPNQLVGFAASLTTVLTGLSIFNTATVVMDRFISLKYPISYRKIATKRKYAFAAAFVFLLAVIRALLISLPDKDFYYSYSLALCISDFNTLQGAVASVGLVFIALVIIILCSCVVLYIVGRRRRQIHIQGAGTMSKNMLKLSMMSILSAGVFCLSYVPFVIGVIWNFASGKQSVPDFLLKFIIVLLLSNSMWNVLIYTANYRPFREALLLIFCRSFYRKSKRNRVDVVKRSTMQSTMFPTQHSQKPWSVSIPPAHNQLAVAPTDVWSEE